MDEALRRIDATLKARHFALAQPPAVYRGPISVHGLKAAVEIEVVDVTFARLPTVKLIEATNLPSLELAHLLTGGDVCYHDGSLPLDMYDPGGSILRVLIEVETALERSFGGGAAHEFERELASYWRGNSVYFALPAPEAPGIVAADLVGQTGDESGGLVVVPRGAWRTRKTRVRLPVSVISLTGNLQHGGNFPPVDLRAALTYLKRQEALPDGWQSTVLRAATDDEHLFLAAPNAIVGWRAVLPKGIRLLADKKGGVRPSFVRRTVLQQPERVELERLTGNRVDLKFCVERNLYGRGSLVGKKVALVGCGTVGSYLARMLVQSGAGCSEPLTIYDTDRLSPGNLGRHLLGFDDLGKWKTDALAKHLQGFHPDVQIEPKRINATHDWDALEKADIIIDATGEPNVATALNARFLRSPRAGPDLALLHAFVFGNGVAGMSFLNLKDGHACYRCLKTSFGGRWRDNPLKDPNSPLQEAPASCGEGGYVPFSVDAPSAAAGLALRAVLEWAAGHPRARLRTVIVDHDAGRDKAPWKSPAPLADCPACGQG